MRSSHKNEIAANGDSRRDDIGLHLFDHGVLYSTI